MESTIFSIAISLFTFNVSAEVKNFLHIDNNLTANDFLLGSDARNFDV